MTDTRRSREFADKLEKDDAYAAACIYELADEVDRLREREVTKWKPLLAAAKEESATHNAEDCGANYGRCALCAVVAACEEKP